MRLRLSPRSAAVFALPVALGGIVAVPTSAQAATYNGPLQITEVQYNGSEFIEFTNTSAAAVNMSGWSFSDSGRTPGAVSFSSIGTLPAGASFILAEDTESTFRAQWGLTACTGLKVIGGNTQNLGRSDEVNIYNGSTLIDRVTYNDQGSGDVKGPRTDASSAYPSAAALGNNKFSGWSLSTVGDSQGAWSSTSGYKGSPGKTSYGSYDECGGGTPATLSVTPGQSELAAAVGNATNPTLPVTIALTSGDVNGVTLTATSSNSSVVSNANISVSGTGANRTIALTPSGVGYATITLTATSGSSTATSSFFYGASASVANSTQKWLSGAGNASTAIDAGNGYAWVADDEYNVLRLYDLSKSGAPVKTFDIATAFGTSFSAEIDLEAAARTGNTIYWTGSISNKKNGDNDPPRSTLFATTISGSGATSTLAATGSIYTGLRTALRNWDSSDTYGIKTGTNTGTDGHAPNMVNVEGLEFAAGSSTTAYLAFRGPIQDDGTALLVPVTNLPSLVTGSAPSFGTPIKFDLGGYGIREIRRNASGQFVIIAGSATNSGFRFYTWDGVPGHAPVNTGIAVPQLPQSDSAHLGSWEALPSVPDPISGGALTAIQDDGDVEFYESGKTSKDGGIIGNLLKSLAVTYTLPVVEQTLTNTPTPTISGTATVGGALNADAGTWDSGVSLAYSWKDGATEIGTTSTLDVTPALLGHSITVSVTGSKAGYTSVTKTSSTVVVGAGTLASTPAPVITGTPKAGETLTADTTGWDSGVTFTYSWKDGATEVGTGATFVVPASLAGHSLTVEVTGSKTGYNSVSETSASVSIDRVESTLTAYAAASVQGGSAIVRVNVAAELPVSGTVSVTGLGSPVTATLVNGSADVEIPADANVGSYVLEVAYDGDSQVAPSTATTTVLIQAPENAVAAATFGGALYAFATADGQVTYRTRIESTHSWGQWASVGSLPAGVEATQVATAVSGTSLFVVAVGDDGQTYRKSRGTGSWSAWASLGALPGNALATSVSTVSFDGSLFMLVVADDGQVYRKSRTEDTGSYSGWSSLGALPGGASTRDLSVVIADGQLFMLATGTDGQIYKKTRAAGGTYSTWASLGLPTGPAAQFAGSTSVVSAGQLFVFAVGTDGQVYRKARSGSSWSGWASLGALGTDVAALRMSAVVSDGQLYILATGQDGVIYKKTRAEATGSYSGWSSFGSATGTIGSSDLLSNVVAVSSDAQLFVLGVGESGELFKKSHADGGTSWSQWGSLGAASL